MHLAARLGAEGINIWKTHGLATAVANAVAANEPYLLKIAIEGKR